MLSEPELVARYEVFPPFARGGMATMHVARLRGPGGFSKLFAVKRQSPAPGGDESDGRMFLEEARLAARIRSPFVVPVIELLAEGSQLSIVMELVQGVSLASVLACAAERGAPMPVAIASAILSDVLRGLHAAHEATGADGRPLELVHRDVSPQNVVVGVDGIARIVDFGIARAVGREPLTATGEVKGKLAYIAPEQLRPGPVTRQADVYAAGAVLWEALVGDKLREGTDVARLVASYEQDAPPPSSRRISIPPGLDDVVTEALSKRPHDRFATAEAMAFALEETCAPASRHEVAAFVEQVAFGPLESLNEAMQVAERHVSIAQQGSVDPPSSGEGDTAHIGGTHTGSESLGSSAAGRRRLQAALVLGLVIPAAVGAGMLFATCFAERPVTTDRTASSTSESLDTPSPPPPEPPEPARATPELGPEPASAPAASDEPAAQASSRSRSRAAPVVHRRTTAPVRPRGFCTPPFTIDEAGIKHYKPKCIP